jgi:hypothetical protein
MVPYDEDKPFRLVISITKADDKGNVLERMLRGTCIAYAHEENAIEAADKFLTLANTVPGKFSSYGVVSVVNEKDKTTPYHVNL